MNSEELATHFGIAKGTVVVVDGGQLVVQSEELPDAPFTDDSVNGLLGVQECGSEGSEGYAEPCFCGHPRNESEPQAGMVVAFTASYGGREGDHVAFWTRWDVYLRRLEAMLRKYRRLPEILTPSVSEGDFVTCPECGERFFSEDGHPAGTDCPLEVSVEEKVVEELPGDAGFLTCTVHGTRYWYEDGCPDCWEEKKEE